jgi:DNA polymerase-1
VHDELVFDAHKEEADGLKALVRDTDGRGDGQLDVPLVVDMALGKNWLEAH